MSKRSAQRHKQERREREGEKRLDAMPAHQLVGGQVKALDVVAEVVERKVGQDESRQPRFADQTTSVFRRIYRWTKTCMQNEPGPNAPVREWDRWYRSFVLSEPLLVGVYNSAVQIDKNRGWTLTGGRNQVTQFTERFHSFKSFETTQGWRAHVDWCAQSFYSTQMGFVAEVGRQGRAGPLATLWSVDPCQCELLASNEKPLRYYSTIGGSQDWTPQDFIRAASLVRIEERALGIGYPAVARCYDLAKIMVGIYDHYEQKLGTKTPDGIVTGKFISEEQWRIAMEAHNEIMAGNSDSYLNSLATIMSSGADMPEFALTILSSMPDRWNFIEWTQNLMRGYALAFGYQSSEFWPESQGVMGRGKEEETQHRAATGKGGKDFSLAYQEQLQSLLPPTLEFEFEERDVAGELEDAEVTLKKAQTITELTKWLVNQGSVLTVAQIMQLAAEQDLIPEEWTPQEEDVTATDEDTAGNARIRAAALKFPSEPIVRYRWPRNVTRTLYRQGSDLFAPRMWAMPIKPIIQRQNPADPIIADYNNQLEALIRQAQAGRITRDELIRQHRDLIFNTADAAWLAGLQSGGEEQPQISDEDRLAIQAWTDEQLSHVGDFADSALAISTPEDKRKMDGRVLLWGAALGALATTAALTATRDMLTFDGKDGVKSCSTCQRLKGQRHRASWWLFHNFVPEPGNEAFECGGWKCLHFLRTDDGQRFSVGLAGKE